MPKPQKIINLRKRGKFMPQFTFKGLEEIQVKKLSKILAPTLSKLLNTPEDWFSFEYSSPIFYVSGEKVQVDASVEIRWFDRGQEIQDETALILNNALVNLGYKEPTVIFHALKKENFYENGQHY